MSCPVPRVEASPASTSAIVVEAETASQASEPASQASDEEDTPATDIYFVSPPGALSHRRALNPHVLMHAHSLTCPHTWTHIAHTVIPVYTSVHMHMCTHVHKHMLPHLYTFTTYSHLRGTHLKGTHTPAHALAHHTHIALNMLMAFTWYPLEHMHTHVVCEHPTSYPGHAIPRPGNLPGPYSPDLLTTAWQESRPQLCHFIPWEST